MADPFDALMGAAMKGEPWPYAAPPAPVEPPRPSSFVLAARDLDALMDAGVLPAALTDAVAVLGHHHVLDSDGKGAFTDEPSRPGSLIGAARTDIGEFARQVMAKTHPHLFSGSAERPAGDAASGKTNLTTLLKSARAGDAAARKSLDAGVQRPSTTHLSPSPQRENVTALMRQAAAGDADARGRLNARMAEGRP